MSKRHRNTCPPAPSMTPAPSPAPAVDQPYGNASVADMIEAELGPQVMAMMAEPAQPAPRARPTRRKPKKKKANPYNQLRKGSGIIPTANTALKAAQAMNRGGLVTPPSHFGPQRGLGGFGSGVARGVSGVNGAIKAGTGMIQLGEGIGDGDGLQAWNGGTNIVGGGSAMMASVGVGGPVAPMLSAGIGLAQRGEAFAEEHLGDSWSDMAMKNGLQTRTEVTEATGNETLGTIAGGLQTASSGLVYGVGALATGAVGLAGDAMEGLAGIFGIGEENPEKRGPGMANWASPLPSDGARVHAPPQSPTTLADTPVGPTSGAAMSTEETTEAVKAWMARTGQ